VYNNLVSNDDDPTIIFGNAWTNFLRSIYNLCITYLNKEIYLMDNDVVTAFCQVKYHPNVISAKAYSAGRYRFVPTGSTFGDKSSPPGFEPFAQARMALAKYLDSNGAQSVPAYEEYLDAVQFADLPDETVKFVQARPDCFNPGVLDSKGDPLPMEYNMYVNDNLYTQVGQGRMRQAMRCSIHALNVVMGGPDPEARPNRTDLEKFLREPVSHHRRQGGYVVDTHQMIVMIPEDKHKAMVKVLSMTWGKHRHSFTLIKAARLLGIISLCRVCNWGIFLFMNLYQAMYGTLGNNACCLMTSPEYWELLHQRDKGAARPTDNARFRFFS
jgi:hypothetical protein